MSNARPTQPLLRASPASSRSPSPVAARVKKSTHHTPIPASTGEQKSAGFIITNENHWAIYGDPSENFNIHPTHHRKDALHQDRSPVISFPMIPKDLKSFVVVTMYNEDEDELNKTLESIVSNLDTSQNIAVCVVVDGFEKLHASTWERFRSAGLITGHFQQTGFKDLKKHWHAVGDKIWQNHHNHNHPTTENPGPISLKVQSTSTSSGKLQQPSIASQQTAHSQHAGVQTSNEPSFKVQTTNSASSTSSKSSNGPSLKVQTTNSPSTVKSANGSTAPVKLVNVVIANESPTNVQLIYKNRPRPGEAATPSELALDIERVHNPPVSSSTFIYDHTTPQGGGSAPPSEQPNPNAHTPDANVWFSDHFISPDRTSKASIPIVVCIKTGNAQKINSHRWFFDFFCRNARPDTCILIDVGTAIKEDAISCINDTFDHDEHVAGACGEMTPSVNTPCCVCPMYCSQLCGTHYFGNFLAGSQIFEYQMSNILDKTMESSFGFITVLPGAFSAYRYSALDGPLKAYYKGELEKNPKSLFSGNMFLAEDRILCFEIITTPNKRNLLRYVRSAKAFTDVPGGNCMACFTVGTLVKQRRRWLNGSFFAMLFSVFHLLPKLFRTKHSIMRKFAFFVKWLYFVFNVIFSWFTISNYYISYYFLTYGYLVSTNSLGSADGTPASHGWLHIPQNKGADIFLICQIFYLGTVGLTLIASIIVIKQPKIMNVAYSVLMILYILIAGVISMIVISLFVDAYSFVEGADIATMYASRYSLAQMLAGFLTTFGLYIIASVMYMSIGHMFVPFLEYLIMSPFYINLLQIYSFLNIHDISWSGPKKEDGAGGAKKTCSCDWKRQAKRFFWAFCWLGTNTFWAIIIIFPQLIPIPGLATSPLAGPEYMVFLLYAVAALALIRVIGCTVYCSSRQGAICCKNGRLYIWLVVIAGMIIALALVPNLWKDVKSVPKLISGHSLLS